MAQQKTRTALSRKRVVRKAVAQAAKGGLDSLSMRKLAEQLDTAPMSLYRHVRPPRETVPFDTPEESAEMAKTTVGDLGVQYPYLAEVVVELGKKGFDYTEEFEFGLALIPDGLEGYLESGSVL